VNRNQHSTVHLPQDAATKEHQHPDRSEWANTSVFLASLEVLLVVATVSLQDHDGPLELEPKPELPSLTSG
jgi:hypothetical protein